MSTSAQARKSWVDGRMACFTSAALSLVLAACGGTDSGTEPGQAETQLNEGYEAVVEEIEGLDGAARRERLIELAEDEPGNVISLYTSMNPDAGGQELWDAFEEDTGIGVDTYRASDEDIRARLMEEAAAGRVSADYYEVGGGATAELMAREGLLFRYEAPQVEKLIEAARGDSWFRTRLQVYVLEWNTDLIGDGQEPNTWEELADPKYDGMIAFDQEEYNFISGLYTYMVEEEGVMTAGEFEDMWEGIADNATFVGTGHTSTQEFVNAGEHAIYLQFLYNVHNAQDQGAPIEWLPTIEPVMASPGGGGPVSGSGRPATALLFNEWLLSDGQEVLTEVNQVPVREDLLSPELRETLYIIDVKQFGDDVEKWREMWDRLVEGRY